MNNSLSITVGVGLVLFTSAKSTGRFYIQTKLKRNVEEYFNNSIKLTSLLPRPDGAFDGILSIGTLCKTFSNIKQRNTYRTRKRNFTYKDFK